MTFALRPLLTILAVAVLVLSLNPSWGFFSPLAFAGAVAALVLMFAVCRLRDRTVTLGDPATASPLMLQAESLVFLAASIVLHAVATCSTRLYYVDRPEVARWLPILSAWGMVLYFLGGIGLALDVSGQVRSRVANWAHLGFVLVFGFLLRGAAIAASPEPVIDVFAWLRDSADHLLAGRNPYSHDITSPYGGERAWAYGISEPADVRPPAYPPLPILWSALPRAFRCDVRWANVVGDLVAALAIAGVGRRRGRPWLGSLAALTYLNLPRAPWIIEQAWYEPMLAGLLGLALWSSEYSDWRRHAGGALLGLTLTAKQYGLPLVVPAASALRRHWRTLIVGLVAGGLLMAPFFLAAPRDFVDIVVRKHLHRELQPHSVTVASAAQHMFGQAPPRWATWVLAGGCIAAVSWRRPARPAEAAAPLGVALLAFTLGHSQGFPNYFHLIAFLWLLGLLAYSDAPPDRSPMACPGAARPTLPSQH